MGRAVVTKGHRARRLGYAIRRMEASVELSSKETQAKVSEQKYKQKVKPQADEDSPVQDLRDAANRKKSSF